MRPLRCIGRGYRSAQGSSRLRCLSSQTEAATHRPVYGSSSGPERARGSRANAQKQPGTHGYPTRVKWVNLTPSRDQGTRGGKHNAPTRLRLEGYSSYWNTRFAKLQHALEDGVANEPHVNLYLHPHAAQWADSLVRYKGDEIKAQLRQYSAGFEDPWQEIWMNALLWALNEQHDMVPSILRNTHKAPHLPSTYISDALYLLIKSSEKRLASDPRFCKELVDLICHLAQRPGGNPLILDRSHVRTLLRFATNQSILNIYKCIHEHNVKLHGQTYLHLASSLAYYNALTEASRCLTDAAGRGITANDLGYKKVTATILRKAIDQPNGFRLCLEIFEHVVQLGLRVNVQLCNIILLNAVKARDLTTTWSVYNSLVDHGLRPDAYTHAILLKGCKMSIHDPHNIDETIQHILKTSGAASASVVASEMLHVLYLHHFGKNVGADRTAVFRYMLAAYTNLFRAEPLVKLGILGEDASPETALMLPRPNDLCLMISAYLRSEQSSARKLQVYRQLCVLAMTGDEPFASLLQSDYVWNVFVKSLINSPDDLQQLITLFCDLSRFENSASLPAFMQPTIDACQDKQTCLETDVKCVAPTAMTWSILLHGLTRQGQLDYAAQVLQYMRENGLPPVYSEFSWLQICKSYSSIHDPDGVVTALDAMDSAGWNQQQYTREAIDAYRALESGDSPAESSLSSA